MRLLGPAPREPSLVLPLQVLLLWGAARGLGPEENSTQTTSKIPGTSDPEIQSNLTSVTTKPPSANTSASTNKTTEKPLVTTKVSTLVPNSALKPQASTSKSVSQSTTAHSASKSSAAPTSNRTMITIATPATATANINAQMNKGSRFDIGSFVGSIILTLGVLSILYIGCKTYYSRAIDEHDAII